MADLTCPACDRPIDRSPRICSSCGHFVGAGATQPLVAPPPAPVPPSSERPEGSAVTGPAVASGGTGTPPVTPGATCRVCGAALDGPACDVCGTPAALTAQVAVHLPDGARVTLHDGEELVLGRESPRAAVSRALGELDTISRRHASVTLRGDEVMVADAGSTNGTWLGERQVGTTPVRVTLPAEVGLGRTVSVQIVRQR